MSNEARTPPTFRDLPITEGMLIPMVPDLPPVPLKQTDIHAAIIGPLADVRLTQTFHNTHTAPLEAIYVFPLPEDAAVTDLTLTIGDRTIRGDVREREQARQEYEAARTAGQGAALLDQERPNLFTVAVANIQPDQLVEVALRFHDRVPFDDEQFTLTLPTVVLPRYVPPSPEDSSKPGIPDADRIGRTPLLPEATRAGHTLQISLELDIGRLAELHSPSHAIETQERFGRTTVTLRAADEMPNRDFILRYRPAAATYETAAFTYRPAGRPGTLLLMLHPGPMPEPEQALARELLFVFDRSGSMGGDSIVQARNALRACLRALNPQDTFNIFPFDDKIEAFARQSQPFTQASVSAADAYIATIDARGGTEILGAIKYALAQPPDARRMRVIVFLTDGAVGNEDQVLRELRGALNHARVFAFGIGSAVNRFLLNKLAEVGRGAVEYVFPGQDIEAAVGRFQNRAALPLLTDLTLDWGGAQVTDVYPDPLPDLYAGQPITLLARFHSQGSTRVTLRGHTARGSFSRIIELDWPTATPDRSEHWSALPAMWARARIDALMSREREQPQQKSALRDDILSLALEYRLASPYTSFVAVEERRDDHAGREAAQTVVVPIHLPQGTNREAFEPPAFGAVMHAMHMPSAAPSAPRPTSARLSAPSTGASIGGILKRTVNRLRGENELLSAPQMPFPEMEYERADPRFVDAAPAERRKAALRFLARTQAVNGSWADSPVASCLALIAFVRNGHTDRTGDYKPQITRTIRWLLAHARTATDPLTAWALHELARATGNPDHAAAAQAAGSPGNQPGPLPAQLTSESDALALALAPHDAAQAMLAPLHHMAGDGIGAVVPPGHNARQPDALVFAATAAAAIQWADRAR